LHDSYLLVIPYGIKGFYIISVKQNPPIFWLVKLLYQRDYWAFTTTRGSD